MRLYLDTSVVSALFDDANPERQQLTQDFFAVAHEHDLFVSQLTLTEIRFTLDEALRTRMEKQCEGYPVLSGKEQEAADLAQRYVEHGALPPSHIEDAYHIATAVVYGLDAILSWNFRHIVRRKTRDVVAMVNSRRNLSYVEILTPAELL